MDEYNSTQLNEAAVTADPGIADLVNQEADMSEFELTVERFRERARLLREAGKSAQPTACDAKETTAAPEQEELPAQVSDPQSPLSPKAAPQDTAADMILKIEDYDLAEAAEYEMDETLLKPGYVADPEAYARMRNEVLEVMQELASFEEKAQQGFASGRKLQKKLNRVLGAQIEDTAERLREAVKADVGVLLSEAPRQQTEVQGIAEIRDTIHSGFAALEEAQARTAEALKEVQPMKSEHVAEITDKIHTESVKTYRNMQELIKESDGKKDEMAQRLEQIEKQSRLLKAAIWLGVLNLAGIGAILLFYLGII